MRAIDLTRPRSDPALQRSYIKRDAVPKVAGSMKFASDMSPTAGILYGFIFRSTQPSAWIRNLDVSQARAVPGVAAVITADDVPNNIIYKDASGTGMARSAQVVLAKDRVRYAGEPVALVAAESPQIGLEALERIRVEYEPMPGVFDPIAALSPEAPLVHEDRGTNLLIHWKIRKGDVEAAFREAAVIVEETYRTQMVDPCYLETESGIGWVDGDGTLVLRVSTQALEHARDVAEVLGIPENQVRIVAPYLGGGFGGKEELSVEIYLGLLVWKTGRMVRMRWSRQESLMAHSKRHPLIMKYRTGATRSGEIIAQQIDIIGDSGAYANLSARVLRVAALTATGPYRIPNVSVDARAVFTNNVPTGAMRGFGAMQVVFAHEGQIDRVAERLGMDPLEIRRRNFLRKGDTTATGQVVETHVALPELLNEVVERLGPRRRSSCPGKVLGRAVACNKKHYGLPLGGLRDYASAWVGFQSDGSLLVRSGVTDVGGGQASALGWIAAQVLGLDVAQVMVHIGDSALNPHAGVTAASRQLYMSGNAVYNAAAELRDRLFAFVATQRGVPLDDLRGEPIGITVGEERRLVMTWPELVGACRRAGIPVEQLGSYYAPVAEAVDTETGQGRVVPDFTYGVHGAEVEIDVETGQVKVLRYVAAHDVGKAINLQSVEGQIQGAVAMGLGQALTEEIVLKEGINQTTLMASYLTPTCLELPDIETIVLESGEGLGPFGARGIGEAPVAPPLAVIAAAVRDAIGAWITELPITPERVLRAMRNTQSKNRAAG